jgi:predicted O-methyltransferase YrrM
LPYNLDIPGWMPETELKVIEALASAIPDGGAMVEVGSFCGRSSWCWARSAPDVSVTCIDIWDTAEHPYVPPALTGPNAVSGNDFGRADDGRAAWGTLENFLRYTADCPNIAPIRGRSPDDFLHWPEDSLDLVFLDGVHHNPVFRADVEHWYRRVRPGGVLCGDDCADTHPDVRATLEEFCGWHGIGFTVASRIWMLRRP